MGGSSVYLGLIIFNDSVPVPPETAIAILASIIATGVTATSIALVDYITYLNLIGGSVIGTDPADINGLRLQSCIYDCGGCSNWRWAFASVIAVYTSSGQFYH